MKLKDLMNESMGGGIIMGINRLSVDVHSLYKSDYINDKEVIILNKAIHNLVTTFQKTLKGKGLIHF